MAQDMTQFDAALKQDFLPGIRKLFSEKAGLEDYTRKNTEDVEGQYARLAIHANPSGGLGSRGAVGATLPTAGQQGVANEQISMRYHYGRIKVELPVIEASRTDKGSVVRALDFEIRSLVPNMKRDLNRQRFGTSDGKIATCAVSTTTTVINLATTTTSIQMRQIHVGMIVDIGTVANPTTTASARTVTAVSRANKTITVSGATFSTAGTDFVFRSGNGGSGAAQKELTGLRTIAASSGTLFNIDPTSYPDWVATVLGNSGTNRTPTESLLQYGINTIMEESDADLAAIVTSYGVHRSYGNTLTAEKRFVNTTEMKGGYSGLEIVTGAGPVGITADRDCPENTAFGIPDGHYIDFEQAPVQWMDDDGAVLSRVSGEPAYEATLFRYVEQATDKRNAWLQIQDLTAATS